MSKASRRNPTQTSVFQSKVFPDELCSYTSTGDTHKLKGQRGFLEVILPDCVLDSVGLCVEVRFEEIGTPQQNVHAVEPNYCSSATIRCS